MLKKFKHFDVMPVRIPYDHSISLKKNKDQSISQTEYAKDHREYYISYELY